MDEELEKPKNIKKTIKRLWKSMDNQYLKLLLVVVSVIFYTVLEVIAPLYSAKVVDEIWHGAKTAIENGDVYRISWQNEGRKIVIFLVIYLSSGIFYTLQNMLMSSFSEKLSLRLRKEVSQKINKLPLSYFDKFQPGEILSRITNDLDKMSEAFQTSIIKFITSIGTIVGSVLMMFYCNSTLTCIFIFFSVIALVVTRVFNSKTFDLATKRQESVGKLTAQIEEAYSGRTIIKSFTQEKESIEKIQNIADEVAKNTRNADFVTNSINPAIRLVNRTGQVCLAIFAGKLLIDGKLTVGTFQAFFQYMYMSAEPLTEVSYMLNTMQSAIASVERVYEIIDEDEISKETKNAKKIKNVKGNIEFKNVNFSYNKEKPLIQNVSFKVNEGQKIAIVGSTGAGKTTLVNLLMRFYDIDSGNILLDGVDIGQMSRAVLRSNFGMVLQDTWLFEGTIAENIAYSKQDAKREEIIEAAKKARIDYFIRTMPQGYDTILNSDAENISVGQKQLLTIARVMLCNPSVLILDEATSSVDTRTEKEIARAMDTLMENRTSFIIAHRLSTIVDADLILVMKNGNVIEQGNHKELLEKNGAYAELYNSQFA